MLIQTRGDKNGVRKTRGFYDAILNPSADFGGLWSFETIPYLDEINKINASDYNGLVKYVFEALNLPLDLLDSALKQYENFDDKFPLSYQKIAPNAIIQNLYNGPTRAFKDMAMQPFCDILCNLAQTKKKKYLILTATSGDTGPATLEAIKNKPSVFGICLYPHNGTSEVQKRQMESITSDNIATIALDGDFDACQSALKNLLLDSEFRSFLDSKNIELTATNSINIGRIAFQIIYHLHSFLYLRQNGLLNNDESYNIIVPSGNFGNALGAFYAKKMGAKIKKIIIATNENCVLCELINDGIYDISNRALIKSNSPAMDILKSSNVERVLFSLFGSVQTKELMEHLDKYKKYSLNESQKRALGEIFSAQKCDSKTTLEIISKMAAKNIIIDPHTATAINAWEKINNDEKYIICSTAEWSKFAPTIANALNFSESSEWNLLQKIAKNYQLKIHKNIQKLFECDCNESIKISQSELKRAICEKVTAMKNIAN